MDEIIKDNEDDSTQEVDKNFDSPNFNDTSTDILDIPLEVEEEKIKPLKKFANKVKELYKEYISIVPLLIIAGIVPLIVVYKYVYHTDSSLIKIYGSEGRNDFFAYYKSIAIYVCTIFTAFSAYIKFCDNKVKLKNYKMFLLIALFGLLNLVSALLSGHIKLAMVGAPARFEGALMWICYCIIAFSSVVLIDNTKKLKAMIYAFLFSIFIVCIIGLTQVFYHDFFLTELASYFVGIGVSSPNDGQVYSTLYNPNVVGTFCSTAFLMVITFMLYSKNKIVKLILSLFSCLIYVNLLCSFSRLGYVGAIVSLILLCILGFKQIKKSLIYVIIMIIIYISIAIGINIYSNGRLSGRLSSLGNDALNLLSDEEYLQDITMNKDSIEIKFIDQTFNIVYNDKTKDLNFLDTNMNPLDYTLVKDTAQLIFNNEAYKDYSVFVDVNGKIFINARGFQMYFIYLNGKFQFVDINLNEIVENIEFKAPKWFFGVDLSDKIGSGRGYIWNRTVYMLKDAIFLGFGADVYPIIFPQNDYVEKIKTPGIGLAIVDKPHNMYLQIACNSGVISLLLFLAFFIVYGIKSLKLCYINLIKSENYNFYTIGLLMALLSVIAFMVSNIFNDSSVNIGAFFWALVGVWIVFINNNLKKCLKNIKKDIK